MQKSRSSLKDRYLGLWHDYTHGQIRVGDLIEQTQELMDSEQRALDSQQSLEFEELNKPITSH